jgi:hypothetical protein
MRNGLASVDPEIELRELRGIPSKDAGIHQFMYGILHVLVHHTILISDVPLSFGSSACFVRGPR